MAQRRKPNAEYHGVLIFSAQHADLSHEEDERRHCECREYLVSHNVPFKEVEGCYQGVKERSFVVPVEYWDTVFMLAGAYGQECILSLDKDRKATCMSPSGEVLQRLPGYFRGVSKDCVNHFDAWTFDPSTGTYYAVY